MYGNYYDSGVFAAVAGILVVLLLLVLACVVLFYVFQGIGLYTMGKRRGVQAPWLAWLVPAFVVGAIADDYDERAKGKSLGLRWILLGLTLGTIVLGNIGWGGAVRYLLEDYYYGYGSYSAGSGIMVLLSSLAGIALLVFYYIALLRVYKSANPQSAVTLLVLSIIFPVIVPFVLFAQRKKDNGMPYGGQNPGFAGGYGAPYGAQPPHGGQNQYQPYGGNQNMGYGARPPYQAYPGAQQAPYQPPQPYQQPYSEPSSAQPQQASSDMSAAPAESQAAQTPEQNNGQDEQ